MSLAVTDYLALSYADLGSRITHRIQMHGTNYRAARKCE